MPECEIPQNLRTARDALQKALHDANQRGNLDHPEALERMLEAHHRFQDADRGHLLISLAKVETATPARKVSFGGQVH